MKKLKLILSLFFEFFKIGLFTFGGGYAMVAVIERELVEKKKWLESQEYTDVVAIAESTPGPIAINSATYIGHKKAGVLGSIFATLGVVLPSFIIILIISIFFDRFIKLQYVNYAFRGIQAGVSFLIISAGIRMMKKLKPNALNIVLISLTICVFVLFTLFSISFSTIFYVLIGGAIGLFIFTYLYLFNRKKENKNTITENQDNKENVNEKIEDKDNSGGNK